MKRFARPIVVAVVLLGSVAPLRSAMIVPTVNQRSANGLYSVDINSTAPNEIIVSIHRHDKDVKIFSWSKKVPWNGANATIQVFPWIRRFTSNDGETVILHNQQFNQESWVWITKKAEPVRHFAYDINRIVGKTINPRAYGSPFLLRSEQLQFLFDEKDVHAMWFPTVDKWMMIDLNTGDLSTPEATLAEALTTLPLNAPKTDVWLKPPSEDMLAVLNAEATRRSLEAVRKHQPSALKSLFKPVQEKLGEFIPSIKPGLQPPFQTLAESYAGYLFLGRRKEPKAESYIRKLLERPFERHVAMTSYREVPEFIGLSHERMLGDIAWGLWNGIEEENRYSPTRTGYAPSYQIRTHYLGGVRGRLNLPMVRPETKPGAVWVYLIPVNVAPGDWPDAGDVVRLYCHLDTSGPIRGMYQFNAIDYFFATIAPGEYRLKAVWDRRSPFADSAGMALPEAGDYESQESEVFTIAAGSTLVGPNLECTNRVGQADTYFAADDAWKRKNPTPKGGRFSPSFLGGAPSAFSTFSFRDTYDMPGHRWIVKSNVTAKNIEFRMADVIQVLPIGAPLERDELIITFDVADLRDLTLRKLVPEIRDEHGCKFEANLFVPTPRPGRGQITVRSGVFPRKKEFTLSLRSAVNNKVLCSYKITNGGTSQIATWQPRRLPIARPFGEKAIRLAALTRAGAKFELVNKGQAADWTPETTIYQDREGNRSFEADDFCREEKAIKVQIAHESQTREFIAEFSDK